jgi:hypothetical protein
MLMAGMAAGLVVISAVVAYLNVEL